MEAADRADRQLLHGDDHDRSLRAAHNNPLSNEHEALEESKKDDVVGFYYVQFNC